MLDRPQRTRDSPRDKTTLATIAAIGRRLHRHRLQGRQRPRGRLRGDPGHRRGTAASATTTTRPRAAAPSASTTTVEFLIDGDFSSYATAGHRRGRAGRRGDRGAAVVVGVLRDQRNGRFAVPPRSWARSLAAAGRTGVIVVDRRAHRRARRRPRARSKIPLVVIDPLNLPRTEVASVGSTNFAGGMSATNHLIAQGHRRIAYVGGPPAASGCNQARLHGYRAAMEYAGLAPAENHVLNEDFSTRSGRRAGAELLALPEPPDRRGRRVRLDRARGHGGRPRPGAADPRGPQRHRFRRHRAGPDGLAPADDRPPAAAGDGAGRAADGAADGGGEQLDSHHVELATELVVRGTTAPHLRPPRRREG